MPANIPPDPFIWGDIRQDDRAIKPPFDEGGGLSAQSLRHSGRVMTDMKERMDALHFIGQSSGWNQSQYDGALRGMLAEIR
jgi:hypothetical protein